MTHNIRWFVLVILLIISVFNVVPQGTIEAGNTVPHMNIIELPNQNYCTSSNFTVPVEYDFGGQVRWYRAVVRVDGVGEVVNSLAADYGTIGKINVDFILSTYSVPAHTTVRIYILTYHNASYSPSNPLKLAWVSAVYIDCTTAKILYQDNYAY